MKRVLCTLLLMPGLARAADPVVKRDVVHTGGDATPTDVGAQGKTDEVVVLGSRLPRASGSVHVISQKQLERYELDDPQQILTTVPGVYGRTEDGYGLRPNLGIRGAISDRSKKLTLMEDGVLFGPAPYSAPAAYYFPLMTRMKSVRVIKGPGAIMYGPQTVGGAIDLITEDIPAKLAGAVDLAYGTYDYRKLDAKIGISDEHFGIVVGATHLASGGFKDLDGGGETGFYRNELMVKGSYVIDPRARNRHTFGAKFTYSDETSHESYLGLTDADFRRAPYRRYAASQQDLMKWHRTAVVLSHRLDLGRAVSVETKIYRNDFDRSWRKVNAMGSAAIADVLADPSGARNAIFYGVLTGNADSNNTSDSILIGPNQRTFVSQGVQTVVRWATKTGPIAHRIEYGARAHYDSIERLHTQDGYLMQGGALVHDGRATQTTANNLGWTAAFAMHAGDAMTWKQTTLTPGVRLELIRSGLDDYTTKKNQAGSYQAVLPGIGAFQGITKELGVLAGVYRGFSPTAPGQSRTSPPETSVNYEAGVRYTRRYVRAEAIGFFNSYSNLTDVCTFSNGCVDVNLDRQFDAGRARIYGVELYGETELPLSVLSARAKDYSLPTRVSYTYTNSQFLNDFNSQDPILGNVVRGDQLPYIPYHQLAASVGVEHRLWAINVSGTYVGTMREVAGQGPAEESELTDAYFLLGAGASVKPLRWLKLYATGSNLLNQKYLASRRPFGARPGAPLMLNLGAKLEF